MHIFFFRMNTSLGEIQSDIQRLANQQNQIQQQHLMSQHQQQMQQQLQQLQNLSQHHLQVFYNNKSCQNLPNLIIKFVNYRCMEFLHKIKWFQGCKNLNTLNFTYMINHKCQEKHGDNHNPYKV